MGSLRLTLCAGVVAAAALAPTAYAADGGVSVTPGSPAPGSDIRLRVQGCSGMSGTAASEAFVADAQLTGKPGVLTGETRVRSTLDPGTYDVKVTCDGFEDKVKGAISVVDKKQREEEAERSREQKREEGRRAEKEQKKERAARGLGGFARRARVPGRARAGGRRRVRAARRRRRPLGGARHPARGDRAGPGRCRRRRRGGPQFPSESREYPRYGLTGHVRPGNTPPAAAVCSWAWPGRCCSSGCGCGAAR